MSLADRVMSAYRLILKDTLDLTTDCETLDTIVRRTMDPIEAGIIKPVDATETVMDVGREMIGNEAMVASGDILELAFVSGLCAAYALIWQTEQNKSA